MNNLLVGNLASRSALRLAKHFLLGSSMMDEVDNDQTLKFASERTLLSPPDEVRKAACRWNGMLAWASCMTFTVIILGVTLVNLYSNQRWQGDDEVSMS